MTEKDECIICFNNLHYNIALLSCGHKYHYTCIQDWINTKNNNICPICNTYFTIITIINQQVYNTYQNNQTNDNNQNNEPIINHQSHLEYNNANIAPTPGTSKLCFCCTIL